MSLIDNSQIMYFLNWIINISYFADWFGCSCRPLQYLNLSVSCFWEMYLSHPIGERLENSTLLANLCKEIEQFPPRWLNTGPRYMIIYMYCTSSVCIVTRHEVQFSDIIVRWVVTKWWCVCIFYQVYSFCVWRHQHITNTVHKLRQFSNSLIFYFRILGFPELHNKYEVQN